MSQSEIPKQQIEILERDNRKFKILQEIQQNIGAERDINKLLPLIINEISRLIEADRTSIFLIDWDTSELRAKFAQGVADDLISIKLRMGIVGWSVLSKQVVNITSASEHPYFNPEIDQILDYHTESILVAPIQDNKGRVIGAIELLNKDIGCFSETDVNLISSDAHALGLTDHFAAMTNEDAGELIRRLTEQTRSERGALFKLDQQTGHLCSLYAHGLGKTNIDLNLKLGIAGLVAVSGQVLNIKDAAQDNRFDSSIDAKTGYRTKTILAVPLLDQNNDNIGVIEVINKRNGIFDEADIDILKGLSSVVAIAIVNAMMFEEQEKQFQSFLEVMAASIDAKDKFTAGHSINVTRFAVGIASELGFNDSEIDVIRTAGLLHDYGKLGIDDQVLKKPGKLNKEEYQHIKKHVTITRDILEKMNFARKYRNVPAIAASHHEYLDGSGYDSGLQSKEIPFMARIITVADVFEALTADRHYRTAMKLEDALSVIHEGVGSGKFDPNVVNALIRYLEKSETVQQTSSSAAK